MGPQLRVKESVKERVNSTVHVQHPVERYTWSRDVVSVGCYLCFLLCIGYLLMFLKLFEKFGIADFFRSYFRIRFVQRYLLNVLLMFYIYNSFNILLISGGTFFALVGSNHIMIAVTKSGREQTTNARVSTRSVNCGGQKFNFLIFTSLFYRGLRSGGPSIYDV